MAVNEPRGPGQGPMASPPAGNWSPNYPTQPASRGLPWQGGAVSLTFVIAIAALIVALTRPTGARSSVTTATRTYTATEIAAAQRQLCDTYKLAAHAVQVDTAGTDKALARIATTNGALMLDMAASNPALDANYRDPARALEAANLTVTAKSSYGVASEADFQSALDTVIAKDAAMKKVCSGG